MRLQKTSGRGWCRSATSAAGSTATTGSTDCLGSSIAPARTGILPEFQQLTVGDKIPWGRTGTELTVGVLEPPRALALNYQARGFAWAWQFGLYPIDEQRTRFVTRGTERVPNTPLWWLGMRFMEPASFIMTRRFLLGVKERAEALRASAPSSADRPAPRQPQASPPAERRAAFADRLAITGASSPATPGQRRHAN